MLKQFGGKIDQSSLEKYQNSPNWNDGKFQNLEETSMNFSFRDVPQLLHKQIFDREHRVPSSPIPIHPFNKVQFKAESTETKLVWYGHSVVLLRMLGKTLLIDPMLGDNASPIAPFATKRFSEKSLEFIDQFPDLDLVLLTHDHYDHLDLASIEKLKAKTKKFFVALGVKRHLVAWGIAPENIVEFDWWENKVFENITITFTPSRHFSGRGLTDRAKSLWGGWAFKTPNENIYFSGDGGYGKHFKEVGEKLGPFDFGLMECGQYDEKWHLIHMFPEESVKAGKDAQVKKIMPVHWAGFALALHTWKDPIERFVKEAERIHMPIYTPNIGEMFTKENLVKNHWWESFT